MPNVNYTKMLNKVEEYRLIAIRLEESLQDAITSNSTYRLSG